MLVFSNLISLEDELETGENIMSVMEALSELLESVVAYVVMIVLGVVSFFVTVFIVKYGASLADYAPSGDFAVLAAALLVAASMLSGSMR